ncbi:MAG: S8 family peptidase [Gammaproteobacteria bacterium]|nr:S8 family peptidase [Gammaproteobacteria bacterium]
MSSNYLKLIAITLGLSSAAAQSVESSNLITKELNKEPVPISQDTVADKPYAILLDDKWVAPVSSFSYQKQGRELPLDALLKELAETGEQDFSNIQVYLNGNERPSYLETTLTLSANGATLFNANKVLQNETKEWKICAENRLESSKVCASSTVVPNRYMVKLSIRRQSASDVKKLSAALAEQYDAKIHYIYDAVYKGFSAVMPLESVQSMMEDSNIASVEKDGYVEMYTIQNPAPSWGLDRVDERPLTLDSRWTYLSTGTGVNAYIIDSGVDGNHSDFTGRIGAGASFVSGAFNADCNGHGTHVAGTVAGTQFGIAKQATVIPVRVFGCSGGATTSTIVAAINWVTNNGTAPAVVNMSLGGSASNAIDAAVNDSINAGYSYVVAAGNSSANACNYSPARVNNAITVGATEIDDDRASYSNFGSCVDVFAPGSDIISARAGTTNGSRSLNGTSMASPHVAGIVALFLQNNPFSTPATVMASILSDATTGQLSSIGAGSPNLLAYWREACHQPVAYHDGSQINPWFDSANCFVMSVPSGATNPFVYAGNYYIDASFTSCPLGSYDGANCYVMPMPAGGFIYSNNFYTTYDACSIGTNDSANCYISSAPSGTTAFIYSNNFYTTPLPGNVCPLGWFDGANCFVMPKPAGGFIYANNFYTTYDACSVGTNDSANCYIASAPAGTTAFIYDGNFYTTADSSSPSCIDGSYDGAHCYIGTAPAGSTPFVWGGNFYYAD